MPYSYSDHVGMPQEYPQPQGERYEENEHEHEMIEVDGYSSIAAQRGLDGYRDEPVTPLNGPNARDGGFNGSFQPLSHDQDYEESFDDDEIPWYRRKIGLVILGGIILAGLAVALGVGKSISSSPASSLPCRHFERKKGRN